MNKLRLFSLAALAALTLGACSKDGKGIDYTDPAVEGSRAGLSVAFTLPNVASPMGRATENATTAESKISTVTVFVFKPNGDLPSQGAFFQLTDSDFDNGTAVGNSIRYEMTGGPLETTSGNKTIYVAANLPTVLDVQVANEEELLKKIAVVENQLLNKTGSVLTDLVMFSKTQEFLYDTDMQAVNDIDVDMERALARLVTTWTGANFNPSGEMTVQFTSGCPVVYTLKDFFVVQDAYRSFLAPNFLADGKVKTLVSDYPFADRAQVVNLYDPADHIAPNTKSIDYKAVVADPGTNARASIDGFYIGENATTRDRLLAQYGSTTYAYIQTTVDLQSTASLNGTVGDASATIHYTSSTPIVSGTDDLIVLNVKSNPAATNNSSWVGTYLVHPSNLDDITDHLQSQGYDKDTDLPYYTYYEGYVYFPVFLNASKTGMDKYNVYRNEFINIQITEIKASKESGFGGYPGEGVDPTVPIDPGTEGPNNPKPWEPTDPIDENDADISVNIVVNPWEYVGNPTILEP